MEEGRLAAGERLEAASRATWGAERDPIEARHGGVAVGRGRPHDGTLDHAALVAVRHRDVGAAARAERRRRRANAPPVLVVRVVHDKLPAGACRHE